MSREGSVKNRNAGFTLIEIVIVLVAIGLLAAMAMQTYASVQNRARAASIAGYFRQYANAFELYAFETGRWPDESATNVIPSGMEGNLSHFEEGSVMNGGWDWEKGTLGIAAGLSLVDSDATTELMLEVDSILDDGNLSTGKFIADGNRFLFILEE